MALSLVNPALGQFDPYTRDKASIARVIALAVTGFGVGTAAQRAAQRQTARNQLLNRPDFTVRAKTTDNSAASQVIDLTDEGVTFPAGTVRRIRFRSMAVSDNDQYLQEWEQDVLGGTTPKLLGSARLIGACGNINGTAVHYGECRAQATYAGDTATAVAANSTAGSSLGNNSTNTITLTHPIARSSPKFIRGINASADVATASEQLYVTGYVAGGTSTTIVLFAADTATPAADGFDDVGVLDVNFFILPPPSVALVMNSNNVEIHCGHDATDDVYHNVAVWIGPAEDIATVAD